MTDAFEYLKRINSEISSLMETVGKQTERGTPRFLQVTGGTFLFFSFAMRVFVTLFPTTHPENFSSLDFLACVVIGVLLIVSGAAIKVYEYKNALSVAKARAEFGEELIKGLPSKREDGAVSVKVD